MYILLLVIIRLCKRSVSKREWLRKEEWRKEGKEDLQGSFGDCGSGSTIIDNLSSDITVEIKKEEKERKREREVSK